jgi:hypothetical protein
MDDLSQATSARKARAHDGGKFARNADIPRARKKIAPARGGVNALGAHAVLLKVQVLVTCPFPYFGMAYTSCSFDDDEREH